MMTAGRATCIVFSDDDLPPEGSDHTRPLYISVAPALEIAEDVIVVDGLFDGPVGLVEGASDFVDPPLSFDV